MLPTSSTKASTNSKPPCDEPQRILIQPALPRQAIWALNLPAQLRIRRLRKISQFAEDEITLPSGPYQGRKFKVDRHPVGRLLFAELDSGRWRRAFITGPNQDGKSLFGFVIPTLYLLFERRETVILGVPSLDLVADKWRVDLLPVIQASSFREQLPSRGSGSRDGDSVLFEFACGSRLRFMTAGGSDKSRASFTSPNLVVTETDGFDTVGGDSREGDKFGQLERRSLAFGRQSRLIAECTTSTETGRTWLEYLHGSHSRIVLQCPHCSAWVTPEREHFVGWENADNKLAAIAKCCIACPTCGAAWSNDQRIAANHQAKLLHKGQTIAADGTIAGDMPQTDTLGFRWTVINSVIDAERLSLVGGIEWSARRAADEEAAETNLRQTQWALPCKPAKSAVNALDVNKIIARTLPLTGRGICPEGTRFITVGCDVGQYRCHWTALAWRPSATPHVLEYGVVEVNQSAGIAPELAVLAALREWRDEVILNGWRLAGAPAGSTLKPAVVFIDAGFIQDTIILFCADAASGPTFFATKGFGVLQRRTGENKRETGSKVVGAYDGYAEILLPAGRGRIVEVDSDHWKTWLHKRLQTEVGQAGALTLFAGNDHFSFAKHLTAEEQIEEFVPSEGTVIRWRAKNRNNHWLDATTLGCVAGHAAGARLIEIPAPPAPPPAPRRTPNSDYLPDRSEWMK